MTWMNPHPHSCRSVFIIRNDLNMFLQRPFRLLYSASSRMAELLTGLVNARVTMRKAQSVVLRIAIAVSSLFAETNKP